MAGGCTHICKCCAPKTGHIIARIAERREREEWRQIELAALELAKAQYELRVPITAGNVIPFHRYRQLPDGWWSI